MEIEFLGTGEACDPEEPNTSFVLHRGSGHILFDCGLTVPHRYSAKGYDPETLDGIWISHLHADHYFGLPLLLLKLIETGRRRRLVITGPSGLRQAVDDLVDLAYGSLAAGAGFAWDCMEIIPGRPFIIGDMRCVAAENSHSLLSLSIRGDGEGGSFFYSGDGVPGRKAEEIAVRVDFAILECYRGEGLEPGHNNFAGIRAFAEKTNVSDLALVHVRSDERERIAAVVNGKEAQSWRICLPRAGDRRPLSRAVRS